jgi:hypothetical protein
MPAAIRARKFVGKRDGLFFERGWVLVGSGADKEAVASIKN